MLARNQHGKVGDQFVFRNRNGKSFTSNIPKLSTKPPKSGQVSQRNKFRLAAKYGNKVKDDPGLSEMYQVQATQQGTSVYQVAVTDFLKAPVINEIKIAKYKGKIGDMILIDAYDDFMVNSVRLVINDSNGQLVEEGDCLLADDKMYWVYTATCEIADLNGVAINALAEDLPGNIGNLEITL